VCVAACDDKRGIVHPLGGLSINFVGDDERASLAAGVRTEVPAMAHANASALALAGRRTKITQGPTASGF
jgi:hypothetical protein